MLKKILTILFFLIFTISLCTGCTPGVVPDPNDPEPEPEPSTADRVVMVELFVAPACTKCPDAKADVSQLLGEYGLEKIVVLEEYAWNYPLSSGWSTTEIAGRYSWYGADSGTPDAYFNGLNQTVHQDDAGYNNFKNAIEAELAKPVIIIISASADKDNFSKSISISGEIKNNGNNPLSNLNIGAMIYEDDVPLIVSGKPTYTANHVVRDILEPILVENISSGETYDFSLTSNSNDLKWVENFSNLHVVVYVQAPNSSTKEILQAMYVD